MCVYRELLTLPHSRPVPSKYFSRDSLRVAGGRSHLILRKDGRNLPAKASVPAPWSGTLLISRQSDSLTWTSAVDGVAL